MIPARDLAMHPGEILLEEFLEPMGLSQKAFAEHLGIPQQRINDIVRGKRGITAETAWLLAQAFGTTPQFWANLQTTYDLATARPNKRAVPALPEAAAALQGEAEPPELQALGPRRRAASKASKAAPAKALEGAGNVRRATDRLAKGSLRVVKDVAQAAKRSTSKKHHPVEA